MRVLVVGGGIAGVSIGYELAEGHEVTVLEAEKSLALHTTGRSAATWIGSYGPPGVRDFSAKSLAWLLDPPIPTDGPIATAMECLWVADEDHTAGLRDLIEATGIEELTPEEATKINPVLRPEAIALGALDREARDLDVSGLHHAYTRALRARGGTVVTSARVAEATRHGDTWRVTTTSGDVVEAEVVVDAAGAWGDEVAKAFGAQPIGLAPKRRTLFTSPTHADLTHVPFTAGHDGSFYFKSEGDTVLCSPQEATDHEPGDPKPDELEIARAIERINDLTTLGLRSVRSAWAGLRTFTPSGEPHVAWDPSIDGFFWFVGQGGWGIQMAPALAQFGAAQIRGI